MIIELGKYNEIKELLIENRATGSWGHVSYRDKGQIASVTRAAVHMGVKGMGMQNRHWGAYNWQLGLRTGMHMSTAEQSEKYKHVIR